MTTSIPTPSAGLMEGERLRHEALQLLCHCRAVLLRRVQRAFLALLLDSGLSTIDPVRAAVPIPAGTDPRLIGAAVRQLAEWELIRRAGLSCSVRLEACGRDLSLWASADRAAALACMTTHPDLPDLDTDESVQCALWDCQSTDKASRRGQAPARS